MSPSAPRAGGVNRTRFSRNEVLFWTVTPERGPGMMRKVVVGAVARGQNDTGFRQWTFIARRGLAARGC